LFQSSPVYVLSAQTICVDTLFLAIHLFYHCPSIALQNDMFPEPLQSKVATVLNAVFILFVIVFNRFSVFTRNRTIGLCVVQYLIALSLAVTSQFLLPCCEWVFTHYEFSYLT
ncbi:hypothetical protein PFISCL1PPCAC_13781, partial [Pristionchus fissidentatus]